MERVSERSERETYKLLDLKMQPCHFASFVRGHGLQIRICASLCIFVFLTC